MGIQLTSCTIFIQIFIQTDTIRIIQWLSCQRIRKRPLGYDIRCKSGTVKIMLRIIGRSSRWQSKRRVWKSSKWLQCYWAFIIVVAVFHGKKKEGFCSVIAGCSWMWSNTWLHIAFECNYISTIVAPCCFCTQHPLFIPSAEAADSIEFNSRQCRYSCTRATELYRLQSD